MAQQIKGIWNIVMSTIFFFIVRVVYDVKMFLSGLYKLSLFHFVAYHYI
jgi:hypothetical protein